MNNWPAANESPEHPGFDFTPVPIFRKRRDGWTVARQGRFLIALEATGRVGAAAKAVGMSRKAAYALRNRAGAASFARAWDKALHEAEIRTLDWLYERAINGITTIRLRKGGAIDIEHGPDRKLIARDVQR